MLSGNEIRALRKATGLSQKALASQLRYSARHWRRFECDDLLLPQSTALALLTLAEQNTGRRAEMHDRIDYVLSFRIFPRAS